MEQQQVSKVVQSKYNDEEINQELDGKYKFGFQKELQNQGYISNVKLKVGPNVDRTCQDFCFLILFIGAMVYYWMFFGQYYISPHIILQDLGKPNDPDNKFCGSGPMKDFKYIYFVTPNPQYLTRSVCVKQCPTKVPANPATYTLACYPNSVVTSCAYNASPNDLSKQFLIYNTVPHVGKFCKPVDRAIYKQIKSATEFTIIEEIFFNLKHTLPVIGASAIIAFLIGSIFLSTLSCCAGFTIGLFVTCTIGFSTLIGGVLFFKSDNKFIPYLETDQEYETSLASNYHSENNQTLLLIGAICCWSIALGTFLFSAIYVTKIQQMVNALKISSIFIKENMGIYLMPFFLFIGMLISLFCWFVISVFIMNKYLIETPLPYRKLQLSNQAWIEFGIQLVLLIVLRGIYVSIGDFIVTQSACLWYYKKNKDTSNVWQATKLTLRYHIGSLIQSSFILTFFDKISNAFKIVYDKVIPWTFQKDHEVKYCCSVCCVYSCCCYTNCFMYLTRYSYVLMAMTGENFCVSCKDAYYLIKRNQTKFSTIAHLGQIFNFIAKLFLSLTTTFICYVAIERMPQFQNKITNSVIPTSVIFAISYTTASFFMDIYGQAADSLLLTSFIDEEVEQHHFGKEDAFNCPPSIRSLINDIQNWKIR